MSVLRRTWAGKTFWRLAFSLAACGFFSAAAQAAGLTLDQAIHTAVQDNKDLRAARQVVEIARARLLQAGLPPNPSLELGMRNDLLFGNHGEYAASVAFTQRFPVTGRIARQKDVARVDVAFATTEVEQAERKLAGEVAGRFYQVLVLDRQIQVRDRLIGIDERLLKVTRDRFRVAEVSELDVNTARLELQRLMQERTLLQNQRALQQARLDQLLGRSAAAPLVLDDLLPPLAPLPPLREEQNRALTLRPDLQAALLGVDRARAELALAQAQRWGDWTVSVGLEQGRRVIEGAPPQPSDRALGVSLSIPLPLLNKNQGRVAEAIAAGTQADARIEALKFNISNEVASAYTEAERLQAAVRQYQDGTLALSDRNVRLAQQGYDTGLAPIVTVVQAQRQQSDLYIAYQATLGQYLQALVALRSAVDGYAGPILRADTRPADSPITKESK